jgi:metalloendopeptidase OMA1, mitochondrial
MVARGEARVGPGRLAALALLAVAVLAGGCGPGYQRPRGEGPGHREQPLALGPRQELAVGQRAYREVMEEVRERVLPADSPEVIRVRHVLERLVRGYHTPRWDKEINLRRGYYFQWEANVVRDQQINAFSLPAGYLFVYTGILRVTGNDDNFLATVLSHEMAHALAHHASERIARERSGRNILRSLAYSRDQEMEADKIGVFLMPFAGYDPRKAPLFWQRMQQVKGGRGGRPELLSDHPSDRHRMEKLREWVPRALAAKQAYDEGRVTPGP